MADSSTLTPQEARLIAKDAFIYAYPMVDSYRILFAYFYPNLDQTTHRQPTLTASSGLQLGVSLSSF